MEEKKKETGADEVGLERGGRDARGKDQAEGASVMGRETVKKALGTVNVRYWG